MRCRQTRSSASSSTSGPSARTARGRAAISNLPRAFFTEKAFPENETVWTTGITGSGAKPLTQRARLRASDRLPRPVRGEAALRRAAGRAGRRMEPWHRRCGACATAHLLRQPRPRQHLRRRSRGRAADGQGERRAGERVSGSTSPLRCGASSSARTASSSSTRASRSRPTSAAGTTKASSAPPLGYTLAQDQGFGRAWSPMMEVIVGEARRRQHRVGCRAAGAGLAQQAAAHSPQRRRPGAAQRTRGPQAAGC